MTQFSVERLYCNLKASESIDACWENLFQVLEIISNWEATPSSLTNELLIYGERCVL